jgi:hypothetical protein
MRARLVLACALGAALSACSAARVAGGSLVRPGTEPHGEALGRWKMDDCRDARGAMLPRIDATVSLVGTRDGRVVLLEARQGFDTIVVRNAVAAESERVFQLALKSSSSEPFVREYRLPKAGAGPGHFAIMKDVPAWQDHAPGGGFVARRGTVALECALVPDAAPR